MWYISSLANNAAEIKIALCHNITIQKISLIIKDALSIQYKDEEMQFLTKL